MWLLVKKEAPEHTVVERLKRFLKSVHNCVVNHLSTKLVLAYKYVEPTLVYALHTVLQQWNEILQPTPFTYN